MKNKTQKSFPDFSYERPLWNNNKIVAGVDEAGRGPLAGPVVAAAVVLDSGFSLNSGINDSKKLSKDKREEFFQIIQSRALAIGVSFIENDEIDYINILNATMLSMETAISGLSVKPDHLLIDGNIFKNKSIDYTTIVKGDGKSVSIAAASIIAKVSRDNWMTDVADKMYPEYEFSKHKGYATSKHIELIKKYGACPIHRRSFLKNIIELSINNNKDIMQLF